MSRILLIQPAERTAPDYADVLRTLDQLGLTVEMLVEGALRQRPDEGGEPSVILLPPGLQSPLQTARVLHARWPRSGLLFLQPETRIDAFRKELGVAPLLGLHWSIEALDGPHFVRELQRSVQASVRRQQFRATLAQASAQLSLGREQADSRPRVIGDHYLANFIEFSRDALIGLDLRRQVLFWSEGTVELTGVPASEAIGRSILDQTFWSPALAATVTVLEEGGQSQLVEFDALIAGSAITLEVLCSAVRDGSGRMLGFSLMMRDITAEVQLREQLKRSEEHLEALVEERTRELRRSQRALYQAQKLEAVGKLTGGVAHDFNNVLQIIGANLQLLRDGLGDEPRLLRRLDSAMQAVDRGARLSTQLLAFARRQPLSPVPTDLGRQLQSMDELLRRALGEHIQMEVRVPPDLWTTLVDPHRLENVVLNLAINARDAMPDGGQLTLELANRQLDQALEAQIEDISPGQYVTLSVADTGCGMPAEVAAQVFEPFFTTKPEGKGTGLGLSMAYGFARQSGGYIRLVSEPGSGTAVTLYLPRTLEQVAEQAHPEVTQAEGGNETILVVEDDPGVQAAVIDQLAGMGYNLLRASDGQSALSILQSGIHIDLLFTDVVMPGSLRSTELARQARILQPTIAVLFTSGYSQDAIIHDGRLDEGVELLSKPYRRDELARRLRQLLTRHAPATTD